MGRSRDEVTNKVRMRRFGLLIFGLWMVDSCRAAEPLSLELLGCEGLVNSIDINAGTTKLDGDQSLEAIQDGCATPHAVRFPGNKVIVLVETQQTISLDYKSTFELRRYTMPSWKVEAKRVLPGKLPDQTHIVPSTDGKAVVVVSLSDDNSHVVSRHAYEAGGILKPVPISSVKFSDLPTDADVEALYHGPYRAELTPFLDRKGKEVLRLRDDAVPGVAIFELGAQDCTAS